MVVHVMQSIPSVFHVYQCRESSRQRQDCGKDTSCFFWRNMKKSGSLCKTVTNVSGWTQSLLKAMQSCTQFLSQPKSGIKWVNCYFDCCMYISSYIHKYVDFISLYMQVGIDMIGPLPLTKKGNRYIVTLVDYFSKWPEAAPLPDKTAAGVALFLHELFCRLVSNICSWSQAI